MITHNPAAAGSKQKMKIRISREKTFITVA
jgi:hypothetical protein